MRTLDMIKFPVAAVMLAATLMPAYGHARDKLTTLYSFAGKPDGEHPEGNIARDSRGNLYGATSEGGATGDGAVFEISPPAQGQTAWTETVLLSFEHHKTGAAPYGGVMLDQRTDIYGTASKGGKADCGTAFRLHKSRTGFKPEIIWDFQGHPADGCTPRATLVADDTGALYGTTDGGGANDFGSVFKLTPPLPGSKVWTESVLWSFTGADGAGPTAAVLMDASGNLYGTCSAGADGTPPGTVWMLTPPTVQGGAWSRTVIWNFANSPPYRNPTPNALVADSAGNLFGTVSGGSVYELTPPPQGSSTWTFTIIDEFPGGDTGLTMDPKGELVLSTAYRGDNISLLKPPAPGSTTWTTKTLVHFPRADGDPQSPVILAHHGIIYGTSAGPRPRSGEVWMISP
jgi:uncharacterized repeat protein (TIGR03803 family)